MHRRGKHQEAAEWARKIPETSQFRSQALRIRIRSFAHVQHQDADAEESLFTELRQILHAASESPSDLPLRFALEGLFEEHLGDLKTMAVLLPILNESLSARDPFIFRAHNSISPTGVRARTRERQSAGGEFQTFSRLAQRSCLRLRKGRPAPATCGARHPANATVPPVPCRQDSPQRPTGYRLPHPGSALCRPGRQVSTGSGRGFCCYHHGDRPSRTERHESKG